MSAIICDLDGTLCNHQKRVHYAVAKQWDEYNKGIPLDIPVPGVWLILKVIKDAGHSIILCTGRYERYRWDTINWLERHHVEFHELYMRERGDMRSDCIIKKEMYLNYIKDDVLLVLEDRKSVTKMWRELGLLVLQVAEGDY
jgi:hypothetical protein